MNSIKMTEREIFMNQYKPYQLKEYNLDEKRMQLLRTLFEIEDINILLVGSQNSGKTTLLYTIIREYYDLKKKRSNTRNKYIINKSIKRTRNPLFS